jgi:hypothetical protein
LLLSRMIRPGVVFREPIAKNLNSLARFWEG